MELERDQSRRVLENLTNEGLETVLTSLREVDLPKTLTKIMGPLAHYDLLKMYPYETPSILLDITSKLEGSYAQQVARAMIAHYNAVAVTKDPWFARIEAAVAILSGDLRGDFPSSVLEIPDARALTALSVRPIETGNWFRFFGTEIQPPFRQQTDSIFGLTNPLLELTFIRWKKALGLDIHRISSWTPVLYSSPDDPSLPHRPFLYLYDPRISDPRTMRIDNTSPSERQSTDYFSLSGLPRAQTLGDIERWRLATESLVDHEIQLEMHGGPRRVTFRKLAFTPTSHLEPETSDSGVWFLVSQDDRYYLVPYTAGIRIAIPAR